LGDFFTNSSGHPAGYLDDSEQRKQNRGQRFSPTGYSPGLPDGIFFKPKIPIWVNLGGSCNGRCWYVICPFGLFYGYLVYFGVIWLIIFRFGMLYQEKSGNPGPVYALVENVS
jgi:hypothetical protein